MSAARRFRGRFTVPSAIMAMFLTVAAACSSETRAVDLGREGEPPGFVPGDAASDAKGDEGQDAALLCMATECPAPYATCGAVHKCQTNLSNDLWNCGACGNSCPDYTGLSLSPRCAAGKCRYECSNSSHLDCNGLVEDGCEVNRDSDRNNCGACGHRCPDGVPCIDGSCGCPPGETDCNGFCTDLQSDNQNCSRCGLACPFWSDVGWPEPPPNMGYRCSKGECKTLGCARGYRDCDGKQENGCEVYIARDPANCGGCGQKCKEGQICAIPENATEPVCMCDPGLVLCDGTPWKRFECADLLNDAENCGACGFECMYSQYTFPNTVVTCNQGRCDSKCTPGFADCDGDTANGCEVDLNTDGSNCGACGNWCNASAGQPCVNGACLMRECDAGEVTR